jgi:hypothetical protein
MIHPPERLQRRHQAGAYAESDHRACDRQRRQRFRRREQQRATRGDGQQRGLDAARPIAVQQHADGNLRRAEREEIGAGQESQRRRVERHVAHQLRRDDSVDRAEQVGKQVARGEREVDAQEAHARATCESSEARERGVMAVPGSLSAPHYPR